MKIEITLLTPISHHLLQRFSSQFNIMILSNNDSILPSKEVLHMKKTIRKCTKNLFINHIEI